MSGSLLAAVLLKCLALVIWTLRDLECLPEFRAARAASGLTAAGPPAEALQYEACPRRDARPWAVTRDVEAHLVAGALKQRPPIQLQAQPAVFRGTLAFLPRSPSSEDSAAGGSGGTFAAELDDFVDTVSKQEWLHFGSNASLKKYFNCPLLSVAEILERASCELLCGDGPAVHADGSFVESTGLDNHLLGLECSFEQELLRRCAAAPAARVTMRLHLDLGTWAAPGPAAPEARGGGAGRATLEVPLCAAAARPRALTACTQPLYGRARMEAAAPHFMRDWLLHHRSVGVEHFHVYDADGSFAEDLSPFVARGLVSYHPSWADGFPGALSRTTRAHGAPLCTELLAYSHCLVVSHRTSDWVVLLHAPDEYVAPAATRRGRRPGLPELLAAAEQGTGLARAGVDELQLLHFPFARHGGCHPGARGAAVRCSLQRAVAADVTRGSPILNPDNCIVSDAHHCIATLPGMSSQGGLGTGRRRPAARCRAPPRHLVLQAQAAAPEDPGDLLLCSDASRGTFLFDPAAVKLNHYVEMLPQDAGRCEGISRAACAVWDDGLLWALDDLEGAGD